MRQRQLGEITLARVLETEGPEWEPAKLIPQATPENLAPDLHWLKPNIIDPATGMLIMATQSYVVRTPHHTIVIDTCVGEEKPRSYHASWNMRSGTRYLADLAALGIRPEQVDFVMCTHLHPDHVGWNTRLVDGRWVPTFANARYIFARVEYEFWEAKARRDPKKFADGSIIDSVLPVVEAGRAVMVGADHAIDDHVWLEPSPGHTPGHSSVRLASRGRNAVMSGDLIHSPVQCAHPEWSTTGCFDKALSAKTRLDFLERYAESDTLVLTAHFPTPSVGYVVRERSAFRFRFDA